jgi:hypothetical protein
MRTDLRRRFAPTLVAGLLLASNATAEEVPSPAATAPPFQAAPAPPSDGPPAAPYGSYGYSQLSCGPCDTVCQPSCAEEVFAPPRNGVFFDYLFLAATDADVIYALPVDGFAGPQVLTGPAAIVDPDYDSGFRVGGMAAIDEISSIGVTYWWWESTSENSAAQPGGPGFGPLAGQGFLQATLVDPGTLNVAADSLAARANYDIDFQMVDLDYRRLISGSPNHLLDLVVGARWGQLDQDFRAEYSILGTTIVDAEIDFDGVGPRIGLDGEYHHECGFMVYSRGFANFLVGDFLLDYQQSNIFAGRQSFVSLDDSRIVPVLELELGLGWTCMDGALRATAGYYVAGWYNAPSVRDFIEGVQQRQINDDDDDNDGLSFNGLTSRIELRF